MIVCSKCNTYAYCYKYMCMCIGWCTLEHNVHVHLREFSTVKPLILGWLDIVKSGGHLLHIVFTCKHHSYVFCVHVFHIVWSKPLGEGYIAVVLMKLNDAANISSELLSEDDYSLTLLHDGMLWCVWKGQSFILLSYMFRSKSCWRRIFR